jgi:hypothetical protein
VKFTAVINRFEKQGEKTGWTYVTVPGDIALQLKPGNKREFKVKGKLDNYEIQRVSLLPMGNGSFIMALNATIRKAIGKTKGAMLNLQLQEDKSEFVFNSDFMVCLADEPAAEKYFQTLTGGHQRYFSKWIDDAKTEPTKVKRITKAVNALSRNMGFPEMLREKKII